MWLIQELGWQPGWRIEDETFEPPATMFELPGPLGVNSRIPPLSVHGFQASWIFETGRFDSTDLEVAINGRIHVVLD